LITLDQNRPIARASLYQQANGWFTEET